MRIYLLRHGATLGNQQGRYIGTTDEPLSEEGVHEIAEKGLYPSVDALYVSPMLRCRQTAEILYPGKKQEIIQDFRECDFGAFENKNWQELSNNILYQEWIDSNGTLPFPQGESREAFQKRCVRAFCTVLEEAAKKNYHAIACVVHGGTIMSILSELAQPKQDYYAYQVKNGCGYAVDWNTDTENMFEYPVDFKLLVCYPMS